MANKTIYAHGPVGPWGNPMDFVTSSNDKLGVGGQDTEQRFAFGTKVITWNGDVYKYGKAGAVMTNYDLGAWHNATGADVSYESIGAASSAGATEVTLTQGSITEDDYAGGYLLIFHATGGGQTYLIKSNEATVGTTTKFQLERPLPVAVTTSDAIELYANPWDDVRTRRNNAHWWDTSFCWPSNEHYCVWFLWLV